MPIRKEIRIDQITQSDQQILADLGIVVRDGVPYLTDGTEVGPELVVVMSENTRKEILLNCHGASLLLINLEDGSWKDADLELRDEVLDDVSLEQYQLSDQVIPLEGLTVGVDLFPSRFKFDLFSHRFDKKHFTLYPPIEDDILEGHVSSKHAGLTIYRAGETDQTPDTVSKWIDSKPVPEFTVQVGDVIQVGSVFFEVREGNGTYLLHHQRTLLSLRDQ